MNLYDNGCYMWDGLVLGMARALISEAEHILDEEDCHIYDSILNKINENCIDTQAVDLLVHTARAYCEAGLLCNEYEEDKQEEGFDLFYDLYFGNQHHLLQEGESMEYILDVLAPRMDLGDFYNVTAEPIAIIEEEEDNEP